MPDYLPFDPNPCSPVLTLPAASCDSQFHVFGPRERYAVREGAAYEMPTATIEIALRMHKILGIERGIIVQATTYGADHTIVLDALKVAGPGYKACANALVLLERDDTYLDQLHAAGVRGARFNRQGLGVSMSDQDYQRCIARVRELGWYVKFQPEAGGIMNQLSMMEKLGVPVMIDHMARANPESGADDPSLQALLQLLNRDNFWVMLSLTEKISRAGFPWDDVLPIAHACIDAAPDRVVWGSDWPHPVSVKQPPNEGDLVNQLHRYAGNHENIRKILVDNPATFFGFDI
ncbi:amidohydrolase family protein [Allopusillimonas ginsengisoli]|uniref:amidohydrolase family protein n=1 Tax=Allopusillimonas ginsengisoli TaxID=453575 RepID=UPI0010C20DA8|nr:2-pyrone-4,6-dicarboxylate hydrolase [Allopusillimonas ginsengisoli]